MRDWYARPQVWRSGRLLSQSFRGVSMSARVTGDSGLGYAHHGVVSDSPSCLLGRPTWGMPGYPQDSQWEAPETPVAGNGCRIPQAAVDECSNLAAARSVLKELNMFKWRVSCCSRLGYWDLFDINKSHVEYEH